jgi:hypothetical protein
MTEKLVCTMIDILERLEARGAAATQLTESSCVAMDELKTRLIATGLG